MGKPILYTCTKTFSKKEYAEDFLKGNLRFMPLNYYTNLEGDSREDRHEGVSSLFQPHLSKFLVNGIELTGLAGPILVRMSEDNSHIFCMSAFYSKNYFFETKEEFYNNLCKPCKNKLLTFGDRTILITNVGEFFKRMEKAINDKKLNHAREYVSYISLDDFHGKVEVPGFVKDLKYKDECEIRFALKGIKEGPFILEIGDISDIAIILDTNDIDKLSFEVKE
ncbi:MAG: hypothetical protein ACRC54_01570 [Fusobacteriaceae bacterium]